MEKLGDKLPAGIGVAFGVMQMAIDWADLKEEVDSLCQSVLCTAIDVLGVLEAGLRKLPAGSQAGRAGYRDEVTRAVVLCCAVRTRPPV